MRYNHTFMKESGLFSRLCSVLNGKFSEDFLFMKLYFFFFAVVNDGSLSRMEYKQHRLLLFNDIGSWRQKFNQKIITLIILHLFILCWRHYYNILSMQYCYFCVRKLDVFLKSCFVLRVKGDQKGKKTCILCISFLFYSAK